MSPNEQIRSELGNHFIAAFQSHHDDGFDENGYFLHYEPVITCEFSWDLFGI
jgi:hypothetical protein